MRKLIVSEFISLDGVMQAPGGPLEDTSGDFTLGGWSAPFQDEVSASIMRKQMQAADYLLGRLTFEIWEPYWPRHQEFWPEITSGMKYVLSSTRTDSPWSNTTFLRTVDEIKALRSSEGRDIQVWGSSQLVHLLLEHGLVDEMWLKITPVVLGKGKRLFDHSAVPASFELFEHTISPSGVIFANYLRSGEVICGTAGE